MKLVSVNTGLPRNVTWHGRSVTTGIFKQPVQGRVALRKLNLDGDRQADLMATAKRTSVSTAESIRPFTAIRSHTTITGR